MKENKTTYNKIIDSPTKSVMLTQRNKEKKFWNIGQEAWMEEDHERRSSILELK